MANNPCACASSNPGPTPTEAGCADGCICICDIIVAEEDFPNICEDGTVNANDESYGHDTTACGVDTQYWSLVSYDTAFYESFSVLTDGTITWNVRDDQSGVGEAVLRFSCGPYDAYVVFFAGAINPCDEVVCDPGEACNKCTGECEVVAAGELTVTEVC